MQNGSTMAAPTRPSPFKIYLGIHGGCQLKLQRTGYCTAYAREGRCYYFLRKPLLHAGANGTMEPHAVLSNFA
jgi:hypothetical protein